jgi:hypothetical protein
MTAHPCGNHPCDHCHQCDVLGVCCAASGPSSGQIQFTRTAPDFLSLLKEAIGVDGTGCLSLSDLVHIESRLVQIGRVVAQDGGEGTSRSPQGVERTTPTSHSSKELQEARVPAAEILDVLNQPTSERKRA